jgi:hypothetical protein
MLIGKRPSWRRRRPVVASLAVALASITLSASVGAQTRDELERARTLFREGVALSAANNWAAALAKFKAVAQVKMTAQVAFNIAECEEKLGKLVSALGNYRLAKSSAADSNAKDVTAQVDARIAALEQRIPTLTIQRGTHAESASIELDGMELGTPQIGSPIPVDPGPHVIVGKSGDQVGSRQTVTIAEQEAKKAIVNLQPSASIEPSGAAGRPPEDVPPDAPPAAKGRSKVPGAVVTAIGGASIVAGVVFLVLRQGTIADLDAACGGDSSCPPDAESTSDKGKLYTGLAEATLAIGVIGVATGIVLIATSGPSKPAPSPTAARHEKLRFLSGAPNANVGGLSLRGSF